jgi:hypothetical protein
MGRNVQSYKLGAGPKKGGPRWAAFRRSRVAVRVRSAYLVQNGTEVGGGGKGCPPGPAANVVHGFTGACATPGLVQSHTPVGNTACNLFC